MAKAGSSSKYLNNENGNVPENGNFCYISEGTEKAPNSEIGEKFKKIMEIDEKTSKIH